jgi:hypothetical protein
LEALRTQVDLEADEVARVHFQDNSRDAADLFRRLAFQQDPGVASEAVALFLADVPPSPPWWDDAAIGRAQEWFGGVGTHVFCALYAGSLPTAYACHEGVQVLAATARLETDAKRRLNETAQFLLDVGRPGGLGPGTAGFQAVRRVRLMHAGVRWLIEHDERIEWDADALGRPINHEDLLLTLLTFTHVLFEVFDRTGVEYTAAQADDYFILWSAAGYLLGVEPDLLPLDQDAAAELMQHVRSCHFGASEAGVILTAALLEQARLVLPSGLKGLPAAAVRWYVGEETANYVGVPPAGRIRVVFGPLAALSRKLSTMKAHHRLLVAFSDRFGRAMLTLAVDASRAGDRAAFAIPEELSGPLGVTAGRLAKFLGPKRRVGRRRTAVRPGSGAAGGTGTD